MPVFIGCLLHDLEGHDHFVSVQTRKVDETKAPKIKHRFLGNLLGCMYPLVVEQLKIEECRGWKYL